jgi:glycosyltransferase involved in cell wall biosynthesis
MALVTVILTTLNSQRFVGRSIESCLNQTHQDLEILVVDGGSRDRTLEIVAGYKDPRIRIIHQEDNIGRLPGAINLGMANARGGFLTWTQDDCWFEPQAVETMLAYLDAHPEIALVYADYWEVDEEGHRLRYQEVNPPDYLLVDDVVRQCFLFRREVYEAIGPQETRYFPVHEVPWRYLVAQRFEIRPLHVALFNYTVHPESLTGRIGNRELRRMMADLFLEKGYFDKKAHRRRLAEIDVNEAYEAYMEDGNYSVFFRYAVSGIRQNWRWLANLGLLKLMAWSLLPVRERYRYKWLRDQSKSSNAGLPDLVSRS